MRKTFKKVVATVTTVALAFVGAVTFNPADAKAADVSTFGDAICVAGEYQGWNPEDDANKLTKNAEGTKFEGTITIPADKTSTDIQLCNFGTWDKAPYKLDGGDAKEQQTIGLSGKAGTLALSYDIASQDLTITDNDGILAKIVLAETFRVVGSAEICGTAWKETLADNDLVKVSDGVYAKTYTRVPASDAKYEVKVLQDADHYGWNYVISQADLVLENGNMGIEVKEISDVTFTVTVKDGVATLDVKVAKSALNGSDVDAMIAALPAVDAVALTDKSAVEAAKAAFDGLTDAEKANVTKKADLDALIAKIADLEAAAADSANVIIHFKNTADWSVVKAYAFDEESFAFFGEWPGQTVAANEANDGWVSGKFEFASDFTVIFNGDGKQTVNIPVTVNEEGKTEVWITMGDLASEPDEFGNINYTAQVSDTKPAGFADSSVAVLAVKSADGSDDTEDGSDDTEDGSDDTDDGSDDTDDGSDEESAWADAALKIHVKMPELENWEKLGLYLFGTGETFGWSGGSGELAGAWPGAELQLENGSETWYAFGGTFADGYYMAIINNFVSDEEAEAGATKCQAGDLELTDGEYWITLDVDADGKFVATVATSAPDDYDGEGLDEVAEAPADDEDGTDDANDGTDDANDGTDDANDGASDDNKKDPASGGTDGLPVAGAMVVVMISGAVVVASRKRKVA